ncbi:phosphatase PAP2 family protein [Uliginosibacterium gangwonense]|uniref:phosphatase PAP2 family protein n=1 Tax=Uliginosibacterium gangwonense TaxID=392736 RepID=UPI000375761F|nr:phosphatase PAP2 family protein [Uliginosibacterium gangwonense]
MSARERVLRWWLALLGNTILYGGTGYFAGNPIHAVPPVMLDEWIGFSPHAIWGYMSFFVLIGWTFLRVPAAVARCLTWLIPATSAFAAIFFWLYPTRIGVAQPCGMENLSAWACHVLQSTDTPYNCLPSLHAAISVLCVGALWSAVGRYARMVYLVWAVWICWSAIALRQHLSADILAGAVLGAVAVWLAWDQFQAQRLPKAGLGRTA